MSDKAVQGEGGGAHVEGQGRHGLRSGRQWGLCARWRARRPGSNGCWSIYACTGRQSERQTSPKVFKLKTVELAPKQTIAFSKTLALTQLTTRTHYPGLHRIELLVNGHAYPLGAFHVTAGSSADDC